MKTGIHKVNQNLKNSHTIPKINSFLRSNIKMWTHLRIFPKLSPMLCHKPNKKLNCNSSHPPKRLCHNSSHKPCLKFSLKPQNNPSVNCFHSFLSRLEPRITLNNRLK